MRHRILQSCLLLILTAFLAGCKSTNQEFSPGAGDSRIVGTWQLLERRFPRDSVYTVRQDTTISTRDTSFYVTKRYPTIPPQTLTFSSDGKLSASGTELTYYYPIRYFRVDSTLRDSLGVKLGVNLYITTNRANVPFQQRVEFLRDTLVLKQQCEQPCYLKFLRLQ